ncbi:MAG: class I SAM-dependent methyltransferase [Acidimicrobiales bacterium]
MPSSAAQTSILDRGDLASHPQDTWPAARRRFACVARWAVDGPVLDLGTGTGWLARALAEEDRLVVGMDASVDALRVASSLKTPKLVHAVASELPFRDSCFQSVVSVEVMEHIPRVEISLGECQRVLQPGGRIIITVPNGRGMYGLLVDRPMDFLGRHRYLAAAMRSVMPSRYLRNRLSTHLDENIRVHHEANLSLDGWMSLFSNCGLKVLEVCPTEGFSPAAGVILRLISNDETFVRRMQRVGKVDERLIRVAPKRWASGWAFLLAPA